MKRLLFVLLSVWLCQITIAQDYKQAVGLRAGFTPGFEYRIHADDANSYKFLLGTRRSGIQLHAIKEFHQYNLFSFSDRLVFVYGFGLHAGYERFDEVTIIYNTQYHDRQTAIIAGLDGLAGVEYHFIEFPVSVGLEAKPFFDLFGERIFKIQPFDMAFTIKYLF